VRYQLVDCTYDLSDPSRGRELYLASHIPGASFVSLDLDLSDLSRQDAGRHPLPSADAFAAAASRAGIGTGVFVVAYEQRPGGGAERLWWLLRHFGHDDCAVLATGAWLGPLRSGEELPERTEFTPRERSGDTIDADELLTRLGEPGLVVVDARAPERYRGEVEPYDPVPGRIPGAVNWPYARSHELPPGLLDADELVVYCGSGVSACVDLLALARAGRTDAKLYAGSWSDWSTRGLPAETG
jgi:thiosulfate/3-mercaptopyruvate sulfurtransferase